MEPELLKSNDYKYNLELNLGRKELVGYLKFFFDCGWISHVDYDFIHELIWKLKVEMDQVYPGWESTDLNRILKELEDE